MTVINSKYSKVGSIFIIICLLAFLTVIISLSLQVINEQQVVETITPPEENNEFTIPSDKDQTIDETKQSSDIRKTIWEKEDYGLRITAPEWTKKRSVITNDDGSLGYTDLTYPEAKVRYYDTNERIYISGFYSGGRSAIQLLDQKYTGKTFTYVINDILPGTGFCANEWDPSAPECEIEYHACYSKDEVIENLILRKTEKFGLYIAQLRGLNAEFSSKNDCRAEDIWLIQAKDGQFVLSEIGPDEEEFRLEAF